MFIKRNAQKNLGETFEVLGSYLQAKSHYTEVSHRQCLISIGLED